MRRRHGKDGWWKDVCHYSPTGWAWWRQYEDGGTGCTCQPCRQPNQSIQATPDHVRPSGQGEDAGAPDAGR